MLTLEKRPQTFRSMAGQDLVKKSLLHICRDPKNAPKTLLLCGPYGSGKTTAARIFAKALNCPHQLPDGDACGRADCPVCGQDAQDSMFYSEYDAAIVGNVEAVKDLRNTFYFGYTKGYKVIVLDEVHLTSKQAQGALLKVFEEPEENVFFLLCTTDPEKLLPTIVSRSFELRYETVGHDDMVTYLKGIVEPLKGDLGLSDEDINKNLDLIFDRSHGHMRNAIMLLDSMFLLKEDFRETVKDSKDLFIGLIYISLNYKELESKQGTEVANEKINKIIQQLTSFPIANLKQDYERLVLDICRHTFYDVGGNTYLDRIVSKFKQSFTLLNILNDDAIYTLFTNDIQFQIAMHILSNKLRQIKRV